MAFKSTKLFNVPFKYASGIANELMKELEPDGYTVRRDDMASGDIIVSITRGGFFRMIVGLKTALKCAFSKATEGFRVEVKVGLFETQAVPTTIMLVAFWPLIVTQIVGIVKSQKLDKRIFETIDRSIQRRVK